eukprot:51686-Rhodomonas_salina.2
MLVGSMIRVGGRKLRVGQYAMRANMILCVVRVGRYRVVVPGDSGTALPFDSLLAPYALSVPHTA